jgi:putative transposase
MHTGLNPKKQHRRSIRLQGYDYSQAGGYFVTIVAHQRACLFGEIVEGEMRLNLAGKIVQSEWERLPQRFEFIQLGVYIVMPNHFHGIIVFDGPVGAIRHPITGTDSGNGPLRADTPEGVD